MKAYKILISTVVASLVLLGAHTLPVFAEPTGTIVVSVQNQTTNSQLTDANDSASALSAKPGDVLKYVIEVTNTGDAATDGSNDLQDVSFTDTLPAGIQLVSNTVQRTITADIGVLEGGKKVVKEYLVTVVSEKDAESLENKACLKVKGQAEKCDAAFVTVSNPAPVPSTPVPTPPAAPQTESTTTPSTSNLPTTGPSALFAPLAAVGTGALAYAGRLWLIKRRQS